MEFLESTQISSDEGSTGDAQLDAAYRTLDRVLGSVGLADNKALIALTFQGAIIAGLALIASPLASALGHGRISPGKLWVGILLLAFLIALCWSTLKLFQTISPRVTKATGLDHPSALFFWGGIASLSPDEFSARIRALNTDDIHDGIAQITFVNASIAKQKFQNLRAGFIGLGVQMVLYVMIILSSIFIGTIV